ncbi:aminotransferase class V-fold PLP-dependent enzyme [Gemmatimonas sp.]|uniref:aminotransferase class V-fold PLP-dependent enzyme n=1 Tax=Gemmatimonas sp. TaxID=1962908 RepID=UPI00286A9DE4|nr:aminotransferase class V-fold PLP-dependent enzyme [Gemmatimonas sp.]
MNSRRSFLASLGALSAATVAPEQLWASSAGHAAPDAISDAPSRGLALAPDDFAFAPGLVYLQTGSLGPSPRPVIERTIASWKELELDPAHYAYGVHEHAMDAVRAKAAAFLGCDTDELVLTRNTTDGMNAVAQGLTLAAGDRVLTTDQEHPGGRVGWDYVARRFGVVIDVVPIAPTEHDTNAIVDRFAKAITPRTRVLSFSHLLSSTGLRMPVAELSALAKSRGCLSVVDGAQAVGGIAVNVKTLGCDVYATSGHKWLLAPKGTGLLYLSKAIGKTVDPIALESGRAAYSASSGVTSLPSVLGMDAAFDYMNTIGVSRVEAHNLALRSRLYAALQRVPKLRVVSAEAGPTTSPLLTFELPANVVSGAFRQRMHEAHRIQLKGVPTQWLNGIRVSTHLFNTEQDVDALVTALRKELG